MDRFQAMQVFTKVAELSSFTNAAEQLRLPRATVTHTIQQLERRLGARLLQRTTRHVSLTLDGEAYLHRCRQLLADLDEAEGAFTQTASRPRGRLRVDLQGTLAMHFLLPHLGEFFERFPEIELDIGLGDRFVDLVREGIDCVLRAGEPKDSSMVGRRVALLPQVTCASSTYLDKFGVPSTLAQFETHRAVNYAGAGGKNLPFEFLVDGAPRTAQLAGATTVRHADAYVTLCRAGMGMIQLPRYHVEPQLASGELIEVLSQFRPAPMPVSVLYPHSRQLSPRVRVFVEWVSSRMQRGA
jgi:DNA-binding transcriptional LysR family regulator